MARLIAFVLAAGQTVGAGHRAHVIEIDAALLIAFVLAAATFLRASLLASCVIGPGREVDAFHHLIHVAAATLDTRLLIAWRAWSFVAFCCEL